MVQNIKINQEHEQTTGAAIWKLCVMSNLHIPKIYMYIRLQLGDW